MQNYLIKNISIVNEGKIVAGDVLIKKNRIEKIAGTIQPDISVKEIDGEKKYLLPGVIDDQVHFREPGLTHKAAIYTEAKAAVAGGTTSFMEMPNTIPPAFLGPPSLAASRRRRACARRHARAARTAPGAPARSPAGVATARWRRASARTHPWAGGSAPGRSAL